MKLRTRDKLFSALLLVAGFVLLVFAPVANAAKVELYIVGGLLVVTGLATLTRPHKE